MFIITFVRFLASFQIPILCFFGVKNLTSLNCFLTFTYGILVYRRAGAVGGFLVPACYAEFRSSDLEITRAVSLFFLVITCYNLLGAF